MHGTGQRRLRQRFVVRTSLTLGVIPFLLGGCPDVRNGVINAVEAATVVALTDRSEPDTVTTFQNNLMQTLVALFYDRLRIERAP